jgi:hypothetical protein
MIAYVALGLVALFGAFTIYARLHAGCQHHGGRRTGGWSCASSAPAAPSSRSW